MSPISSIIVELTHELIEGRGAFGLKGVEVKGVSKAQRGRDACVKRMGYREHSNRALPFLGRTKQQACLC